MPRAVGLRLLSGLFVLFASADLVQLGQAARGEHPDPLGLLVIHALTGLLAGFAAVGLWRARPWASVVVLSWGMVTGAMLMILGPVLDEPREAWWGFWVAALLVVGFASAVGLYVRHRTRRLA
jgi:hypothetical protein